MLNTQTLHRRGTVLGVVVIALGLAVVSTDSVIGWLVPLALLGGGLVAVGLALAHARSGRGAFAFDPNANRDLGVFLNVSSVRVAGLGGAGLLFLSLLVAVQFPFVSLAVIAGGVGGVLGAVAAIRYRASHGVLPGALGLSTSSVVART